MERWWKRILDLLPGAQFEVLEVLVNGGPWRTRIAVRNRSPGPLPTAARNQTLVFQLMPLRWGRAASVESLEDLQVLEKALQIVADHGKSEALADPILD